MNQRLVNARKGVRGGGTYASIDRLRRSIVTNRMIPAMHANEPGRTSEPKSRRFSWWGRIRTET